MNFTSQKSTFQTYTNGINGTSPHIGEAANGEQSGYWYIGTTNTGIKAQGADAVTMQLSNDSDIIVRNNLGVIVGDLPTTQVFVLKGANQVEDPDITEIAPKDFEKGSDKHYTFENGLLTINKIPDDFNDGVFTFSYSGIIEKSFSLKVVSSEVDYNLIIDKTLINSTKEGGAVKITIKKVSADGTRILEEPADEAGVQLRINNNDDYASSWQIEYDIGRTTAIPVKLEVQVGDEWVVWDEETIEFVANGAPGGDGASLQVIYKKDTSAPTTPTGENPNGWDTNMPSISGNEKVYMSQKMSNSVTWSTPIQISAMDGEPGKDGGDIEYVYYLCNNDEAYPAPTTSPSYNGTTLTSGWTPSPSGVSPGQQYEYVSVRTKPTGGNWGPFSPPVVWSKWGEKGQDGDGVTYHYCLTNSDEAPIYPTPADKSYTWEDDPQGVTESNQYEYVVAIKTGEVVNSGNTKTGTLWAKFGEDGNDATAYWLQCNTPIIAKQANGTYTTTSVTFTPMMQVGDDDPDVCGDNIKLAIWADNEDALTSGSLVGARTITLVASKGEEDRDNGKFYVASSLHCRMFFVNGATHTKVDEEAVEVLADGVTITKIEYAINNSGTVEPATGWSTNYPASIQQGFYLWARTTYSNGQTATSSTYQAKDANQIGQNLASSETIGVFSGTKTESEYHYTVNGSQTTTGLEICNQKNNIFKDGKNYVVSYKFLVRTSDSQSLTRIAGHDSCYTVNKAIINGKEAHAKYSYNSGYPLVNADKEQTDYLDTELGTTHTVELYITYNANPNDSSPGVYIQPFRSGGVSSSGFEFVVWDLKVEEGEIATKWLPPYGDNMQNNSTGSYSWQFSPSDGIKMWRGTQDTDPVFSVDVTGLYMNGNGTFTGTIKAQTGNIGKLIFDDNMISSGTDGLTFKSDGLIVGTRLEVDTMHARKMAGRFSDSPYFEFESSNIDVETVQLIVSAQVEREYTKKETIMSDGTSYISIRDPGSVLVTVGTKDGKLLTKSKSFVVKVEYNSIGVPGYGANEVIDEYTIMIPQGEHSVSFTCAHGKKSSSFTSVISKFASATSTTSTFEQDAYTKSNVIKASAHFLPLTAGSGSGASATGLDLGASNCKWNYVFALNNGIGSDRKIKDNITDMDDEFSKKLIDGLNAKSYTYNTTTTPRIHYGFIAQDVEELLHSLGTSADEVGIVCKSKPGEPDGEDNHYSLNYINLIAPMVNVIQQLSKRVEELEEKLNTTE